MCGIVGYVGDRECKELLLTGLERLEYRGYDSAGICLINGEVDITRRVGKVQVLRDAVGAAPHSATTGLAHTRWATHGGVTEQNAHPIEACEGSGVTVVHNGIIENYQELRRELAESGHVFHSDTDTEVIAHLVEEMYEGDLVEAAQRAYARLRGHFAIAVAHRDHPHVLVGARRQCPLVVGVGDNEMFMASAIPAFLSETRRVQYVEDDEIVIARPGGAVFLNGSGSPVEREVEQVDWDEDAAEKQGYETFMLKEIEEQPDAIAETIGERLYHGELHLDGLELSEERIRDLNRIVILACGTSYHAGLIGRYLLEEWARVPSESDIASERRAFPRRDSRAAATRRRRRAPTAVRAAASGDIALRFGNSSRLKSCWHARAPRARPAAGSPRAASSRCGTSRERTPGSFVFGRAGLSQERLARRQIRQPDVVEITTARNLFLRHTARWTTDSVPFARPSSRPAPPSRTILIAIELSVPCATSLEADGGGARLHRRRKGCWCLRGTNRRPPSLGDSRRDRVDDVALVAAMGAGT